MELAMEFQWMRMRMELEIRFGPVGMGDPPRISSPGILLVQDYCTLSPIQPFPVSCSAPGQTQTEITSSLLYPNSSSNLRYSRRRRIKLYSTLPQCLQLLLLSSLCVALYPVKPVETTTQTDSTTPE